MKSLLLESYRVLINEEPYMAEEPTDRPPWEGRGAWPCFWVGAKFAAAPCVVAYRKFFTLSQRALIRVHVSGDERYVLYLDGAQVGRGSERGDVTHWSFETYDFPLDAGEHVLVAKVWSMGGLAPVAQFSLRHGFILAPDEADYIPILGTGVANWECKSLPGYKFVSFPGTEGAGAKIVLDGTIFPWDFANGGGVDWKPVERLEAGASFARRNDYGAAHLMRPALLPPMLEKPWLRGVVRYVAAADPAGVSNGPFLPAENDLVEAESWAQVLRGKGDITISPRTFLRVLIDLEDYVCAYPEVLTSQGRGSVIKIGWAEALKTQPGGAKGNRDEWEENFFEGVEDIFLPDGNRMRNFQTLWWEAGRYVQIVVQTGDEPLIIHSIRFLETRYPLEMESCFKASDARLAATIPPMLRSLQTCAHETFVDCPYYEQLMYAGDTRTEALTTFTLMRDHRLQRKALELFAASRLSSGLTQSRYPSRGTQIIPPFSLWWVAMVHDYALWRGDVDFIKSLMPTVRGVIDCYLNLINKDGLVQSPAGWNFTDWVHGWDYGVPPDGDNVSGVINLQLALVLGFVAKLEDFCERPEMAAQALRFAQMLAVRCEDAFWNETRGLYSDDLAGKRFSEHAQCLAILAGFTDEKKRERIGNSLSHPVDMALTGIYFSHYLFETYYSLNRNDLLMNRLEFWFGLEAAGFKTTPETIDPARSDCHAWGAHPLYHYFASILGIRPASMGFQTVRIAPQLGSLTKASGTMVHPTGDIVVDFKCESGWMNGTIILPPKLSGTFVYGQTRLNLVSGLQSISAPGNHPS